MGGKEEEDEEEERGHEGVMVKRWRQVTQRRVTERMGNRER